MNNNYTWEFPAFDCYPTEAGLSDVVFNIHWRCTADDGAGHTATIDSTQAVTFTAGSPFTPFNEITFDQAQHWVQAALGMAPVTALQQSMDQMIEDQIHPKVETLPAPWANNENQP